jgi:hypothetical protein
MHLSHTPGDWLIIAALFKMDHLQKSRSDPQRVQGAKGSRIRLKCVEIIKDLKDDTQKVERMLKALIKSLENKHLDP